MARPHTLWSVDTARRTIRLVLAWAIALVALSVGNPEARAQGVAGWGYTGFSNIDNLSNNIVKIAAGGTHTVALTSDGTVACWGSNYAGQCNVPASLGTVTAIAAGGTHTVALTSDGTVACWGRNDFGQCNVPASLGIVTAIAAGYDYTASIKSDGTVACWGRNDYGQCNVPASLGTVTAIAAGAYHTVAVKSDGTVACWGYNSSGQCMVPPSLGAVTAIAAGGGHTVAIKANGTVACWGANIDGQCNVPASLGTVTAIAAGGGHTVAVKSDGTVTCWGYNSSGQCMVPPSLGAVTAIAAGGGHTVAIKANGTVACWGANENGQCAVPAVLGIATSLAAGFGHTAAIRLDGTVACWGWNVFGQCNVPASLGTVTAIAAGDYHTAAIKTDGTAACWGYNNSGQCSVPASLGTVTAIAAGSRHTVAIKTNGTVACWGSNSFGQCAIPVTLGTASGIAAGFGHTIAIKTNGTVACWGLNDYGQCNVPASLGTTTTIAAGGAHAVAIRANGTVLCWGLNNAGQCTVPASLEIATAIAAGDQHTVALKPDGTVACWGQNDYAQCAVPAALDGVTAIAAGFWNTVARGCAASTALRNSGNLGAIGSGSPREVAFNALPPAVGEATLTIRVRSDLDLSTEYLTLWLDGVAQPDVLFGAGGSDCPSAPDSAVVAIPAAQFAALLADGALTVRLEASALVSATQCPDGFCEIGLQYANTPIDCNGNGFADHCEIAGGAEDMDQDGVIDDCEIARGDFDLDGVVSANDLAVVLSYWNVANAPLGDLNGDGVVGAEDLAMLLSNWGALPPWFAPRISSVSPNTGPTTGGTAITISGVDLTGASAVTIGGVAATSVNVVNSTTVTAITPAGTVGSKTVSVTTPAGTGSLAGAFTYVALPTISSVTPSSGPVAGGTSITITGTDLSGTSAVTVGGVAATSVSVVNSTTVTAVTPAGTVGAKTVSVTTPAGTGSLAGAFTYVALPTISLLSPSSGPTTGGTSITITGTNLAGTSAVTIGGVAATSVSVVNSTTVTAVTPAGTVGAKDVMVTTPAGSTTLAGGFTYLVYPSWGTVLEALPDPAVVTNPTLRNAIVATGYPWRVRDIGTNIEMVLIPPGTFNMGCTASNGWGCYSQESPVHPVTLTGALYLGRYEVTQAQWTAKMGSNPSSFQSASAEVPAAQVSSRPVEQVSWDMVQNFMTATGLRLPTEAEWEYACRAGTTTAFHGFIGYPNGTNDDTLAVNIAWYSSNSISQTRPVGGKAANGFGLHDMVGNVWEWVSDWYSDIYYASSPSTNPQGPASGTSRVMRGGAWAFLEDNLRSSARSGTSPGSQSFRIGFRVAKSPSAPPLVTAVAPNAGSSTGGTSITITGTNLAGTSAVTIGGAAATSVSVVNSTTVTAVTPAGTVGAKDVVVTTPAGSTTLAGGFTYLAYPSWGTVLEGLPDPAVVTNPTLRNAIVATCYPWRVRDIGTNIEMVLIPPGTFNMGCSPSNAHSCGSDESPVHSVTLTNAFYLGRYEVTQAQWTAKMGSNPSAFQSATALVPAAQVPNRPVEQVSWTTIQGFLTATGMRLPTEAEWEYAYRAGTTTAFHGFMGYPNGTNDDTLVGNIAWTALNSGSQTRPVGGKAANGYGLHDMAGNVLEWVNDWYGSAYYASSPSTNPPGPLSGAGRGLRGSSWEGTSTAYMRSSQRGEVTPGVTYWAFGFRVARAPL